MPQTNTQLVTVVEDFAPSSVDAAAGIIRGVKLLGFESKNGRIYPPQAVRNAVGLYENAKVNINHPEKGPSQPRTYQDRIGVTKSARIVEGKDGGIFADFHYNPKHPLAEQIAWDAQNNPSSLGFSHNALLKFSGKNSPDGRAVVEAIVNVKSVDLVADPATTRSLFESEDTTMDPAATPAPAAPTSDPLEMIVDSIAAKIGEIAKAEGDPKAKIKEIADLLKKQDKIMALLGTSKSDGGGDSGGDAPADPAATEQINSLKAELAKYKKAEKAAELKQTIEGELIAAGLEPHNPLHVSEVFGKSIYTMENVEDRKALIADRAAMLGVRTRTPATPPTPRSQAAYGQHTEGANINADLTTEDFCRRLKS